jgi:hypothetical protein
MVEMGLREREVSPTKVRRRLKQVVAFSMIDEAAGQVGGAKYDKKSWLEAETCGLGKGQQESNLKLQSEKECGVAGHPETSDEDGLTDHSIPIKSMKTNHLMANKSSTDWRNLSSLTFIAIPSCQLHPPPLTVGLVCLPVCQLAHFSTVPCLLAPRAFYYARAAAADIGAVRLGLQVRGLLSRSACPSSPIVR